MFSGRPGLAWRPAQTAKLLTADSSQPLGVRWAASSGSGITSLNGQTGGEQTFANDTHITISRNAVRPAVLVREGSVAASPQVNVAENTIHEDVNLEDQFEAFRFVRHCFS